MLLPIQIAEDERCILSYFGRLLLGPVTYVKVLISVYNRRYPGNRPGLPRKDFRNYVPESRFLVSRNLLDITKQARSNAFSL